MAAAALVVAVLLSGCGGAFGGAEPSAVPGLSANGVENASQLAAANERVLSNQTHIVDVTETLSYENGSLRGSKRATYRVDPNAGTASAVVELKPPNSVFAYGFMPSATTVELYRTGTDVRARGTNATATEQVQFSEDSLQAHQPLRTLLSFLDLRYNGTVERDGETAYVLEASQLRSQADANLVAQALVGERRYEGLENVSFTAFVNERGLVQRYDVRYAVEKPDGTVVQGERTVTFDAVGSTTVERPAWVAG